MENNFKKSVKKKGLDILALKAPIMKIDKKRALEARFTNNLNNFCDKSILILIFRFLN
jgi:hypothetical protein